MKNTLPPWLSPHINKFDKQFFHHAHLIAGRSGVGKNLLSSYLSKMILCNAKDNELCGSCQSCKLAENDNHPDFHRLIVLDDKKLIGIAQIQELISKLYESPFLAKNKVVIIPNLEKLSIDGLNAILKILEEPPKNTYFFLTTSFLNQVPLTIQSRCFDIKIGTPNKELALEWLSDFSEEEGILALSLTNNLPLLAKELLEKNILNEREQFIKEISSIIKEGKNLIFTSEKWIEDKDFLNLKLEWMSKLLCDSIKFNANNQIDNLTIDTDNITKYLAKNTDVNNLHNLLSKTNRLWNLFSKDTNLRKDYQLNSLFVDWEISLGISKKI
jgi:DNA polymerase III subunit delta'